MAKKKIKAFQDSVASQDPPRSSVYGVCLVLPQVGRSLGWPPSLVGKVVQAYVVLGVCWALQFAFIGELYKIERLRSLNCQYQWGNQTFIEDENTVFEDQKTECMMKGYAQIAGSGDYPDFTRWHLCGSQEAGVPYITRMLCITIFIVYLATDVRESLELARCVLGVPTCEACSWVMVRFSEEINFDPLEGDEKRSLDSELQFSVSAIPMGWKIFYMIVLVLFKIIIVIALIVYGTSFLFNESDRVELILNAIAFCFVIDIDEMLFSACAQQDVREKMDNLQSYTDHQGDIPLSDSDDLSGSDIEGSSDLEHTDDEPLMAAKPHFAVPKKRVVKKAMAGAKSAMYGGWDYCNMLVIIFKGPVVIVAAVLGSFEWYASTCPDYDGIF